MTPNTDSEMANLLKITEANSSEMKIVLKVMKRRLPGGVTKSDLSPTEPMIRFDENSLKVPFIYYVITFREKELRVILLILVHTMFMFTKWRRGSK